MFCKNCGRLVSDDADQCPFCGKPLNRKPQNQSEGAESPVPVESTPASSASSAIALSEKPVQAPAKGNTKKLGIGIGITAIVVAAVILIALLANNEGNPNEPSDAAIEEVYNNPVPETPDPDEEVYNNPVPETSDPDKETPSPVNNTISDYDRFINKLQSSYWISEEGDILYTGWSEYGLNIQEYSEFLQETIFNGYIDDYAESGYSDGYFYIAFFTDPDEYGDSYRVMIRNDETSGSICVFERDYKFGTIYEPYYE